PATVCKDIPKRSMIIDLNFYALYYMTIIELINRNLTMTRKYLLIDIPRVCKDIPKRSVYFIFPPSL
ncbi:MAG TPA: hypothetical protein VE223_00040, partial [Nitrososphaeraceae archaeon]|nr:hypothetical protein [Nitrososphaeraceae archaeon]